MHTGKAGVVMSLSEKMDIKTRKVMSNRGTISNSIRDNLHGDLEILLHVHLAYEARLT